MPETDPTELDRTTRRTVLSASGAIGLAALLAGCTDDGGPGEEGEEEDPAAEDEEDEPAADEEEEPAADEEEEPAADEEEEEDTDGDEEEEDTDGDGEAIEPDTQIVFEAQTQAWLGVEPEEIADEENPTLTLQEGETYEIGWEEGDGAQHNIEIRDEDDEVVDDYSTEISEEGGEDQFIEFEATDEMAAYACEPHEDTMYGDIELEAAEDGEEDTEEEDGMDEEENGETDAENGDGEDGEEEE